MNALFKQMNSELEKETDVRKNAAKQTAQQLALIKKIRKEAENENAVDIASEQ